MEPKFKTRMIEIQTGDAPFSGFRICSGCGHAGYFPPAEWPYNTKHPPCPDCKSTETMIPLLDREVVYYLSQRWKLSKSLRDFRSVLDGFAA